jgi:hypothetical protein
MKNRDRSTRTSRDVPHASYTQGSNSEDECIFSFNSKLKKPTAAVAKLTKGDVLHITLDSKDNIQIFDKSGVLCGYIISSEYQKRLISCIKKSKHYEAKVLKVTAMECEISIYAAK